MAAASSILIASAVVAAGTQVVGGIRANQAAKTKEELIKQETAEQVELKQDQIDDVLGSQKVTLAASGVELGSELEILEETRLQGLREIEGIKRQGDAQAQAARSAGRSALIGSVGSAVGTLGNAYGNYATMNAKNFKPGGKP